MSYTGAMYMRRRRNGQVSGGDEGEAGSALVVVGLSAERSKKKLQFATT